MTEIVGTNYWIFRILRQSGGVCWAPNWCLEGVSINLGVVKGVVMSKQLTTFDFVSCYSATVFSPSGLVLTKKAKKIQKVIWPDGDPKFKIDIFQGQIPNVL